MAMSRFNRPDTATLTLTNGDTLVVKRRLNSEESRLMKAMQEFATLAEPAVVMAYLVSWSLVQLDGTPDSIDGVSRAELASRLNALEESEFDEIHAAIAAHRDAMVKERDAQKKIRDGASSSNPIFTLPSALAPA